MEFDTNVNYLEDAFWQIIISAGPVLISSSWNRPFDWYYSSGYFYQRDDIKFCAKASACSSDVSLNCQLYVDRISRLFCFHF